MNPSCPSVMSVGWSFGLSATYNVIKRLISFLSLDYLHAIFLLCMICAFLAVVINNLQNKKKIEWPLPPLSLILAA